LSSGGHDEEIRSLLSDLPPGKDSALLHLLTCPDCRDRAIERLAEVQEAGEDLPDYQEMWDRLQAKVPWMIEEVSRRKAETEAFLGDLMSRPRHLRAKALLEETQLGPQDLVEASQEAQLQDPERAVALAEVALQVAARCRCKEAAETVDTALSARALILQGNAYRLLGNLTLAEKALVRATYFLAWPLESCDRGEFCRSLGLVRWEQGRLDEAAGLLRQAARVFAESCQPQEQGASLVLCGLLGLEQNRADLAIGLLQRGRETLDPAARPWLTVRAGLGLALALAEIGETSRSRSVLKETWRQYAHVADEREQVRIYWLEGRIWAQLGQREEAEPLLTAARHNLLAECSFAESVLCSLDLAVLFAESGRGGEAPRLFAEIEETFVAEHAVLDVIRRLSGPLIAATASVPEVPCAGVLAVATPLRRMFRARGYRVESLPFA